MAALERSDLQQNATAYAAQLAGEAETRLAEFVDLSQPLTFNTSRPGLCYSVGLLVQVGASWSKAARTVAVLTSKRRAPRLRQEAPSFSRLLWSAFCVLHLLRTSAGPLSPHPGL